MKDKLLRKRNTPPAGEPWIWLTREMLESDAWRTAPINTRRVVDRLLLEHMAHAGTENGNLACTYQDFEKYGVTRRLVSKSIADAVARGLTIITQKGRASSGEHRWPSRYALGWLPTCDAAAAPNRWKVWVEPERTPIALDIIGTPRKDGGRNRRNLGRSPSQMSAETPTQVGVERRRSGGRGNKQCYRKNRAAG